MKPWVTIDRVRESDGATLLLARRGDEWVVRCDGKELMSTRQHGSEEALARLALEKMQALRRPGNSLAAHAVRVLIGGLGLGFTARAALDRLSPDSTLVIAEMSAKIVEWNRRHVGEFAARPLEDPRVVLLRTDAVAHLYQVKNEYDAILLDLDNGPAAMVHASNDRLYNSQGIAACRAALKRDSVLAVWSSGSDASYLKRLGQAGLEASCEAAGARGRESSGTRHAIFLGVRRG